MHPTKGACLATGLTLGLLAPLMPGSLLIQAKAASSPSFNCAKASGQVEQLICRDAELAALDRQMAATYAKAMHNWPANVGFWEHQGSVTLQWFGKTLSCKARG